MSRGPGNEIFYVLRVGKRGPGAERLPTLELDSPGLAVVRGLQSLSCVHHYHLRTNQEQLQSMVQSKQWNDFIHVAHIVLICQG